VHVALELESGPFTIKKQSVSADGTFEVHVFGDNGHWVHPDMGLSVRQVFPNNRFVAAQPWIDSLALPATPDDYLTRRPELQAPAQATPRLQTVTWNAPEARHCTQ
jgi:hypothetical protein